MLGFEVCPNTAPYIFTTQYLVNLFIDITAMGLGKSHTNFGVLLAKHGLVITVGSLEVQIFE